jgi:outer membrane lipoprotein-sorting protein
MRGKMLLAICCIAYLVFTSGKADDNIPNAHDILTTMLKNIAAIKTLTYELDYTERKDDSKFRKDSSHIKYQRTPLRVYMKMADGAEILWGPDINGGDALVHPNAFPYFNLNLSPLGSIMRKNQHHGIDITGFDYFGSIIQHGITKVGKNFDTHFLYLGEIAFNGFQCYNIVVLNTEFKYVPYTVLKGENILTIAKKLFVDEFMIQAHNHLSSFNDVKEGQTIMVPSDYGKELTLYIDKKTQLPVMLKVSDDKGLFEEYHFHNITVNPEFASDEFSKNHKGYGF